MFPKPPTPHNPGTGRLDLLILLGWLANLVGLLGTAWSFMARNRLFYLFIALWVAGFILRSVASALRRRRRQQILDRPRRLGALADWPSAPEADSDATPSDQPPPPADASPSQPPSPNPNPP